MQLIRNKEGTWDVTRILLYKEPLFTPRKEPYRTPCFADGTEPTKHIDGPTTTYTHLDIFVGDHLIHTYNHEDMLLLGEDYANQIIRTWSKRAQELWDREKYPSTEDETGSVTDDKNFNPAKHNANPVRREERSFSYNSNAEGANDNNENLQRKDPSTREDPDPLEGSSKDYSNTSETNYRIP